MFRYFVIVDDVWRQATWDHIKAAFPNNEQRSIIVVTTRDRQVANSCCSSPGYVYEMEPLGSQDSKKLLFKTVFKTEECPSTYSDLEPVCMATLEKCGGLPLAIISIGGMLAQRINGPAGNWQGVIDRLPSELKTNRSLQAMRRILSLSCNDLPYHLKACFSYLCVFPEDYEIRRGPLVRRWAAEGLISELHDMSLEEVARSCFDEFVTRSIVTPVQLMSNGEARSFKVHDVMLDVITSKSNQENFVSFLGSSLTSTTGHDKIRRLSIQPGYRNTEFSSRRLSHTRSLTILSSTERPGAISFTDLRLLRVLDLQGCRWLSNRDLKDICQLPLLKYLNLRDTTIQQLPEKIGKLKELVTLDVRQTSVKALPNSITRLQNLNHLMVGRYFYYTRTHSVKSYAYDQGTMIPPGLGGMRALKRISNLDISRSPHAMREVERMSQLTRICVINTEYNYPAWEHFDASLSLGKLSNSLRYLAVVQLGISVQLEFLERLDPPPILLHSLHLVGKLTSSTPTWILSLVNLTSISLRESHLDTELITVVGKLPVLVSLKLYTNSYTGSKLCFERDQFPRLKQLVVDNLPSLDELSFQEGAPNLERLTLSFLSSSRKCILGIQNLKKLREVEFFGNIFNSVVDGMKVEAKVHPNNPRITREDLP